MKTGAEHALRYAAEGLLVVPVHTPDSQGGCSCDKGLKCSSPGKHPRIHKWPSKGSRDEKRIHGWWKTWPDANVGIVTGAESGLVVLDIDPRHDGQNSLRELVNSHGPLPQTPTVNTGGGGLHYYFRHPGGHVTGTVGLRPGLDIRADGNCVIAPPSRHQTGNRYEWANGLAPWEVSLAPCPEWLLTECRIGAETLRFTDSQDAQAIGGCSPFSASVTAQVEEAVRKTQPQAEGQRNRAVFSFAQILKGIPELADQPLNNLKPYVRAWHERALPIIGTKPFDDTWSDFRNAWRRIRYPGGLDLPRLVKRLASEPDHPAVAVIGYETRGRKLLLALCAEFQKHHGERPFYLSSHVAAKAVGIAPKQAYLILFTDFIEDGVLELVEKGKPNSGKATTWRFVWKPD